MKLAGIANIKTKVKPVVKYKVPLYGGEVRLFCDRELYKLALTELGYDGKADEQFLETVEGCVTTLSTENGYRVYMMGIFGGNHSSTLVHEVGHVTLIVMQNVGCDPEAGNGEPFCYLLGDMFQHLASKMYKHLAKQKLDTSEKSA